MEQSPAVRKNDLMPSDTPGIGVAGMVMCPYGFQRSPCLKSGCELWVELDYNGQKVGRCSHAWDTILKVELRQEIANLRKDLTSKKEVDKEVK